MSKYLTTKGAAVFLGRTPGAIGMLVLRGKIPFRKPGGRLMFLKSELEEWVESAPGISLTEAKKK